MVNFRERQDTTDERTTEKVFGTKNRTSSLSKFELRAVTSNPFSITKETKHYEKDCRRPRNG